MRLKLDENLGLRHAEMLRRAGHDVDTVHDESLSGAPDEAVLAAAREADRALVTLDLDFADPMRFPPATTAGLVVLRPRSHLARDSIEAVLAQLVAGLATSDVNGRLWVVEPGRLRQYEPPPPDLPGAGEHS